MKAKALQSNVSEEVKLRLNQVGDLLLTEKIGHIRYVRETMFYKELENYIEELAETKDRNEYQLSIAFEQITEYENKLKRIEEVTNDIMVYNIYPHKHITSDIIECYMKQIKSILEE